MTYHSLYHCPLGNRAQHTRRILVQLCKYAESPMSSTLPACRDTTCYELRIEDCINCTCTNFGPQNLGRNPTCVPTIIGASRLRCPCQWRMHRSVLFAPHNSSPSNSVVWPSRQCVTGNQMRVSSYVFYETSEVMRDILNSNYLNGGCPCLFETAANAKVSC
jgi:hypothetical protein